MPYLPLKDIAQSSATSGQVPTWNGSNWVPETPSGGSLSGLTDVNVSGVVDGDLLVYVGGSTNKWVSVAMSGDATISDTGAVTLASVITAGGPIGSASVVPIITYDAKGRLTATTTAAIAISDSAITYGSESAHTVLAGPTSGSAAAPTWRTLVAADIPSLSYVTSVALSAPSIFSVSGSPVTSSGTLTFALVGETANYGFFGPSSGSAAAPTFRAMVPNDIAASSANGSIPIVASSALSWLSIGTSGKLLNSNGSAPGWSAFTAPTSVASGDLWYGSGTNALSALGIGAANTLLASTGTAPNWVSSISIGSATITIPAVGTVGLTVKGIASQTADYLDVVTSASAKLFYVNSNGQVVIGAPSNLLSTTVPFTIYGAGSTTTLNIISSTSNAGSIVLGPSAFVNLGVGVAVYSGDTVSSGTRYTAGQLVFAAAENQSSSALGTDAKISVCAATTTTLTARFYVRNNGDIECNGAESALSTSATGGFVFLPTGAGKPTGTPTSRTGNTAHYFNSSQGNLWAYTGSAWNNVKGGTIASYTISSGVTTTGGSERFAKASVGATGTFTFALPSATGRDGELYTVMKNTTNTPAITITGASAPGSWGGTLTNNLSSATFISDGSTWYLQALAGS